MHHSWSFDRSIHKSSAYKVPVVRKIISFSSGSRWAQDVIVPLWKINMKPENDGLEDEFPFQMGDL